MAIQLGRWDCLSCGQKGNLGNVTSCPACGSPRGEDVEFYLPEDADDITEETLLKEAAAGVDWFCDYCGSDNKATATTCKSCGNERSKDDINRRAKEYSLDEVPDSNAKKKVSAPPAPPPKMSLVKKILFFTGITLLILAILFWPRSFKVEVIKHTWERTVEIENNRPVSEEDWQVPAGGQMTGSFRAIHHYDKVFDHYENRTRNRRVVAGTESYKCGKISKGNGYFEDKYCTRNRYENRSETYQESIYRNVPAYRTKYRYTIFRWLKDHTLNDKGSGKNSRWPSENLKDQSWREGKKTEKYTLFYRDKKGREYNEEVDYPLWNKVDDGQQLSARKNSVGVFYGIEKEKI
jgi:hypothetical protein